MNLCSFPDCDRDKGRYRTYCGPHMKQRASGKPMKPLYNKDGAWTLDRLLAKADVEGDCLLWPTQNNKYANVWHDSTNWKAHRLAYHLATGEDITGVPIHHKCANARCVNPAHLQRASHADNVLEMLARKDYEAEIARLQLRIVELEAELERAGLWQQ